MDSTRMFRAGAGREVKTIVFGFTFDLPYWNWRRGPFECAGNAKKHPSGAGWRPERSLEALCCRQPEPRGEYFSRGCRIANVF